MKDIKNITLTSTMVWQVLIFISFQSLLFNEVNAREVYLAIVQVIHFVLTHL